MKYFYYPGCSLEGTAKEYDISTRAFLKALGIELIDIPSWTCCGATAAEARSRLLSFVLPGVNLALAEQTGENHDILAPCSACYLNLKKVEAIIQKDDTMRKRINLVLGENQLRLQNPPKVRHLLDILITDMGGEKLKSHVTNPLAGMTFAAYTGCQCLRPFAVFDDPERPKAMESLLRAAGANVLPWKMGGRCCGASNMSTKPKTALFLVREILASAKGADAIITVCPMCQMNLEGYQKAASCKAGYDLAIPVLYLPQVLGMACGIPHESLGLLDNLTDISGITQKMKPYGVNALW